MENKNQSKQWIQVAIITLLLIIGTVLRLYGLGNQSFWNDELSSWSRSNYSTLTDMIEKGVKPDKHPPGYQTLIYYVERNIGDTESTLRLPSALAGILAIWFIFLLGKKLFTKKEALIAAALMSFLWCPIHFSQEARAYSLLLLFSLVTINLLWDMIKILNKEKRLPVLNVLFYILSSVILSYLHYFGIYFLALQALLVCWVFRKSTHDLLKLGIVYLIIGLAYLPWIPTMIIQFTSPKENWIEKSQLIDFPISFVKYIGFFFNNSIPLILIIFVLFAFLPINIIHQIRNKKSIKIDPILSNPTLVIILWLFIPFLIVFLISTFLTPVLTERNLIICLPAAYLLLARTITLIPIRKNGHTFISVLLIIIFFSHLIFIFKYYSKPHKAQFREAVNYIIEEEGQYDQSAIIGHVWFPSYLNYYFKKGHSETRVQVIAGEKKDTLYVAEYLKNNNPKHLWYIAAHKIPDNEFLDYMNTNYTLINKKLFLEATVWLYEIQEKLVK